MTFPIGHDELARHHAKADEALYEGDALRITVVVLAGPGELAGGLDHLCDHIVDEPVDPAAANQASHPAS